MTRTVRFGLIIVLAVAMSAAAFGQSIQLPTIHGPTLSGAQIAGVVAWLPSLARFSISPSASGRSLAALSRRMAQAA